MASSEALGELQWAMCPTLYRRICMVIKIASDWLAYFIVIDLNIPTNVDKDQVKVYININQDVIV